MEQSPSKAYAILESSILSKPRMMGTPAEEETTRFIMDHLRGAGLAPFTEDFQWSNAFVIARKVMSSILVLWLLVFNIALRTDGPAGGIFSILIPVLAVLFLVSLSKVIKADKFSYLGKMSAGKNVICDVLPDSAKDPERMVYFTAHTDSVASSMPKLSMPLTIGGYLLFMVSALLTLVGGITRLAGSRSALFLLILLVTSTLDSLLIIIGLFSKRVDNSPGAIDNGSGSAVLLDLAGYFHQNRPSNTALRFIFCAAEEWGLYGSKGYVRAHQEELMERADQDLLITVDMVGSDLAYVNKAGLLFRKPLNKHLNRQISEIAEREGIEARAFSSPLASNSDHAPFRKLKMETAFFLSQKDTKKIHKPLDTIEKVNPQKMKDAVKLLSAVVMELDIN